MSLFLTCINSQLTLRPIREILWKKSHSWKLLKGNELLTKNEKKDKAGPCTRILTEEGKNPAVAARHRALRGGPVAQGERT